MALGYGAVAVISNEMTIRVTLNPVGTLVSPYIDL